MVAATVIAAENVVTLSSLERHLGSGFSVIPFIGAGLSVPYTGLDWAGFLKDVAGRYGVSCDVQTRLAAQDFEGAANRLIDACTEGGLQQEISRCFGPHVARNRPLTGVLPLIPDLTIGPVVTTNFDRLIERAFEERGLQLAVVRGGDIDTARFRLSEAGRHALLKIHGDAEERTGRVAPR